ncbi:hypothetical protein FOCC_FOCC016376 [Frankliniella occidentalis]|nr:hypothetical protein FOCC_FOCC016376 [Frankliniella occidentalis]
MTEKYRDAGYVVIEKWGCEFAEDLKSNNDVINFFENKPFTRVEPLNLRDALYGGRTSALFCEYVADLKQNEKIKMFDVISEYPACQHHRCYPEGHPDIFCEGDPAMPDISVMNGVVKATVLPPQNLFIPVLPYRCCKKLLFPLCRTCAETMNQNVCNHSDKEREMLGTWCAPELKLAVEKGYTIIRIHECYQYPKVREYNPKTKQDGMFSSYVRENMAMKIESTGWPSHVVTEEQKDKFIKMHFDKDGIVLDKSKFKKNPGKRTLAKLILNSFYSICFVSREGLDDPPLGEHLGDLSDQLSDDLGKGSFGLRFCAAGAKNYSLICAVGGDTKRESRITKVRGLTIDQSCKKIVTFERLSAMVRGEYEKTTIQIPTQIARVSGWRIVSRPSSKVWRVCLNKRRRIEGKGITVPYGFTGETLDRDDYDTILAMMDMDKMIMDQS